MTAVAPVARDPQAIAEQIADHVAALLRGPPPGARILVAPALREFGELVVHVRVPGAQPGRAFRGERLDATDADINTHLQHLRVLPDDAHDTDADPCAVCRATTRAAQRRAMRALRKSFSARRKAVA